MSDEINEVTELLARAWIDCDPNRAGNPPGSGFHPDDIIGPSESADASGSRVVRVDPPSSLDGKPRWHWFIPRAEKLADYLAERGYRIERAA